MGNSTRVIYSSITEDRDAWPPERIGRGGGGVKCRTLVASLHLLAETTLVYGTFTFKGKTVWMDDAGWTSCNGETVEGEAGFDLKASGTHLFKSQEAKQVES